MNPRTFTYRNGRSSGVPWTTTPFGTDVNQPYVDFLGTHEMCIESPQPFSINDRSHLLLALKETSPDTKRVAHVLTRLNDGAPDRTTYTGRMIAAFPKDEAHRVTDGSGAPTTDIDLLKVGDDFVDFVVREVLRARFADGTLMWDGLLLDFFPRPADPEGAANWDRIAARLRRLAKTSFLLGGNMNGAVPDNWNFGLYEGFPAQNHGTIPKIAELKQAHPTFTPLLFAAVDVAHGGPGTRAFKEKRVLCHASAAAYDGYAGVWPGETESGVIWWEGEWINQPRYNLGRARGPVYNDTGLIRRDFTNGSVLIDPPYNAGIGRAWIVDA